MSGNGKEATVTLRVSADMKQQVARIAKEIGISQNAVWKILIARYIRPALEDEEISLLLESTLAQRRPPGGFGARSPVQPKLS